MQHKSRSLALAVAAGVFLAGYAGPAMAQSAKSTAGFSSGILLSSKALNNGATPATAENTWVTILSTDMRMPSGKEVWANVSLMCGNYTFTQVKTRKNAAGEYITDTTSAGARVVVRVLVTPAGGSYLIAAPGVVTFCDRQQTLSAKLGDIITNLSECTGPTPTANCELEDQEIALGIKTLNANAYNFYYENLPESTIYTIEVQASLNTCAGDATVGGDGPDQYDCGGTNDPDAEGWAYVGGASIFAEEVRFVK